MYNVNKPKITCNHVLSEILDLFTKRKSLIHRIDLKLLKIGVCIGEV